MAQLKIYSKVSKGRLSEFARNTIMQTLASMDGVEVEIVIKEKKRSLPQNKYRWAVVTETVMRHLNIELERQGLPKVSPEDVDLFIKDKALGVVHKINTSPGELTLIGRLKDKTIAEFEDSMAAIRAYFAEKGIMIPLPGEEL